MTVGFDYFLSAWADENDDLHAAFGHYNGGPRWRGNDSAVVYADHAMQILDDWRARLARTDTRTGDATMSIDLPPPQRSNMNDNYYEGRGEVTLACLHGSVGMTDAWALADYCRRAGVSYHAACDNTEIVYQVNRSDSAWHLRNGNREADGLCLTTALEEWSGHDWFRDHADKMEIAAWWLSIICADRGIDILRCNYSNVRDALAGSRAAGGVIIHEDYTLATGDGSHTDFRGADDPGPGGQTPMQHILARAAELAGYANFGHPLDGSDGGGATKPKNDRTDEYTVQTGDTLASIGEAVGVTWQAIAKANSITEPYTIYPGQVLVIPAPNTNPAPSEDEPKAPEFGHYFRADSPIEDKWRALGGVGWRGKPTTKEFVCPDGVGHGMHFAQGASIYWHPEVNDGNPHEVHGSIRNRWQQLRWEKGPLGYPVSDEHDAPNVGPDTPRNEGDRISEFQHGSILWDSQTGRVDTIGGRFR